MTSRQSSPPTWMRVAVRVDFVAAVALTVVAPLLLLAVAIRAGKRGELQALLRYWRVSSLLMVTVYLLIGERRAAFPAGVAARLLIAHNLLSGSDDLEGNWAARWRRVTGWYCLVGTLLTAPMLRGAVAEELPPLCRAYIEPTQEFAALLHPGTSREQLGRIGDIGLALFLVGALIEAAVTRRLDQSS